MGSSCCGNCKSYKKNKIIKKTEFDGKCKHFKIKVNHLTSSCDKITPVKETIRIEPKTDGGNISIKKSHNYDEIIFIICLIVLISIWVLFGNIKTGDVFD